MKIILMVLILVFFGVQARAQSTHDAHQKHDKKPTQTIDHEEMKMDEGMSMDHKMVGQFGDYAMSRESSGTAWQPEATPHQGFHFMAGDWMLMAHGFATGIYDYQSGSRGDDQFFSSNMFMLMGQHSLAKGTFGFRSMLSLEPATIGKNGYPLLLQTGETGDGINPLIDRQHPHDLFMELSISYSHPLGADSSLFGYFGLPGEPALGPPTFMHRFSGMEIPEAPLSHHWMDSTHISFGVATLGFVWKDFKLDGSVFTGREPDEKRWNFDKPRFDSFSARLSYNPTKQWAFQLSGGHLNNPEQLEPNVDIHRFTASTSYHCDFGNHSWQSMLAWGLNVKDPGNNTHAVLLESLLNLNQRHNILGRVEIVGKDELFLSADPRSDDVFTVGKLSLGYIYDLPKWNHIRLGIGGLGGMHFIPESLKPVYGDLPLSFLAFVRAKVE